MDREARTPARPPQARPARDDTAWGGWTFIGAGRYDPRAAEHWTRRFLPTTRGWPANWTREGRRRHTEQTLANIAFLQGNHMTRRDVDVVDSELRRRTRLAEQVLPIVQRMLADPRVVTDETGPMPRPREAS